MRLIHDDRAATVVVETLLLFSITVMLFGMVMLSFSNINDQARETVMREQYYGIGNDVASKILYMDREIKSSLSQGAVVSIEHELDLAPLVAEVPYLIELGDGKVIVSSMGSPSVTVEVPFNPAVNVVVGSATGSTEDEHVLSYDPNGQIMFKNGGVDPTLDETWPEIAIILPLAGATLKGTKTVIVDAWDDVEVTMVEYYVDENYRTTEEPPNVNWIWDTTLEDNGDHMVTAIVYDRAGHFSYDTRDYFIDNPDRQNPTVQIITPPNGSSTDFSLVPVHAIVRDDTFLNGSTIQLWFNNISVTANATITKISDREYDVYYLPPPLANATHYIKLEAEDAYYNVTTVNWKFTVTTIVDAINPTISLNFPLFDEHIVAGEQIRVEYTATDNAVGDSGIDYLIVNVTENGSTVYTKGVNVSVYPTVWKSFSGSALFNQTYKIGTNYTYDIKVYDRKGNSKTTQSGPLRILTGMASFIVVEYIDTNNDPAIVEFNIRATDPAVDIKGMKITYSGTGKLDEIFFAGLTWWSKSSGEASPADITFSALYRVPMVDTATKLSFKNDLNGASSITIVINFDDGTSKSIQFTTNP